MPNIIERRVCQKPYKATRKDLIDLTVGDVIEVFQNAANGWSYGKNVKSNYTGWFPTNFTTVQYYDESSEYSYYEDEYSCSDKQSVDETAKEIAKLYEMIYKTQESTSKLKKSIYELKQMPIQTVDYQSDPKDEAELLAAETEFLTYMEAELQTKLQYEEIAVYQFAAEVKQASEQLAKAQSAAQTDNYARKVGAEAELAKIVAEHKEIQALQQEVAYLERKLYAKELVADDAVEYIQLKREVYGLARENEALKAGVVADYGKMLYRCRSLDPK